jgi:ankyrin repeat protein
MKKIISILLCLPALGYAMEAPLKKTDQELAREVNEASCQYATQELLKQLPDLFPFTFGKDEKLKQLINYGANLNIQDEKGNTLLMLASKFNYPDDFIELLLQQGANPNITNNDGDMALIFSRTAASTQMLLEFNANPNIQNNNGVTALHDAVRNNWPKKISTLLKWDANPNIVDNGVGTALIDAVLKENPEVVRMLLQAGANTQAQNKYGMTALHFTFIGPEEVKTAAERAANLEIIEMLTNPENIQRSGLKKAA